MVRDPYVFAVPASIDLAAISDPDADLPPDHRKVLNSCIRFNFASQHSRQVEYWYQEMLPSHRLFAQCRSYEVALSMVRAGLGVCLVPALAVYDNCCGAGGMKPLRHRPARPANGGGCAIAVSAHRTL